MPTNVPESLVDTLCVLADTWCPTRNISLSAAFREDLTGI